MKTTHPAASVLWFTMAMLTFACNPIVRPTRSPTANPFVVTQPERTFEPSLQPSPTATQRPGITAEPLLTPTTARSAPSSITAATTSPVAPKPTATISPTANPTKAATQTPRTWQRLSTLPRQVNTFVSDPSNPQVLYAGTGASGSGSGVFKSEDAGQTWQLAAAGLPTQDMLSLAFARDGSSVLYGMLAGGQLHATDDGANSWKHIGGTGSYNSSRHLVVSPHSKALYDMTETGNWARSTDGGYNWLRFGRETGSEAGRKVSLLSLAIDPTNPSVLYGGTFGDGVLRSIDGGDSWSAANQRMLDYGIATLAIDPVRPQTIYAGSNTGELFKSTDGGESWDEISDRLEVAKSERTVIREIVMDPGTRDTLYVLVEHPGILVSHDGGASWTILGKPGAPDHPNLRTMLVLHNPSPTILIGLERAGAWRYAAP